MSKNAKVDDVMTPQVMTMTPHVTTAHVRELMSEKKVGCFPVVDSDGAPVGIVTSADLVDDHADGQPISQYMAEKLYTVPRYEDVSIAARIMRNHHIHHVVVVEEQRVVGVVSSFDLLKLVEGHRFVMKNAPTQSTRKGGKRKKAER